jgi:hypothetical protein
MKLALLSGSDIMLTGGNLTEVFGMPDTELVRS